MAITQIRGSSQIQNQTLTRDKLALDFLEGSDLDLTNGAGNATITGLREGSNPRDAVTYSQLEALEQSLAAALVYRGTLTAGADLSGNTTGNPYIDATNGLKTGDLFIISGNGYVTDAFGNQLAINSGDHLIANKTLSADTDINVLTDFDKVDNTEADDILRESDVVDNLTSTSTVDPLSANQGRILGNRITAREALGLPVYNELPAVTANSATITLSNVPIAGSQQVYLNGVRQAPGSGNDYSITGDTITFAFDLKTNDVVLVDYMR